ncbi:MAG TPA: D-alanyl-D-alanine carboxypeptidase/D-alanyl-D-alanine-endopeptidase [Longimicrobiales bacterium]|nr:D-alanyl-D-alanine carboxypeptidase/D-alanyl-D-alanine-endopeptidase [Longimicrobiales bacterium]
MRRSLPILLALASAAACAPARTAAPHPGPARGLAAVVDSIATTPPLHRTHWGVEVGVIGGTVLFRRNADDLFIPASNAKLPTLAAALDLLGPGYTWMTEVEAREVFDGVAGALVVRGSGDPTFSLAFHDAPLAALDSLADSLALAGVREVAGPLVVDQSRFDSVLVHPAWERYDVDWYYAAPVAPFAVMAGAYPVVITPGAVGEPARVEVTLPAGLIGLDSRVATVDGERGWNDDVRRIAGADSAVLRGEIGAAAGPDTSWLAQDEPGRLAGRALALALERRGIRFAGDVVVARDSATLAATLPAGGGPRVRWRSAPLADAARPALGESDNWITEQVLKTLGAELGERGSWSQGTAVVERFLTERVGVDSSALYLRDGSGLTAQNLITPRALVQLLRYAADRPWGEAFRDALASPGEIGTTLEERLACCPRVAAKTGTIRHVNALSGYATMPDGSVRVFSILTNASGRPASEVRRAMDRIVEAILQNGS